MRKLLLSVFLLFVVSFSPSLSYAEQTDTEKSIRELRKAADQGDVPAQLSLGVRYYKGQGVPQDYAEAVKWFRKAADQGDVPAQLRTYP